MWAYWRTVITHDYDFFGKLKWLFVEGFNVVTTGLLIWIAIDYSRSEHPFMRIVSYGLLAALTMYYLEQIVATMKRPAVKQ